MSPGRVHTSGCLCEKCIATVAEKARKFYEENEEGLQSLEEQGFPFVKELRELAGVAA